MIGAEPAVAVYAERFSWQDYLVFGMMLLLSAGVGVYHGFFGHQQKSTTEYLLGGRNLRAFPVAMSLVASYISGVTVLGTPADIYKYGSQYWIIVVGIAFMGVTVATVFLPVFCTLQIKSSYEYLEMRFDRKVRTFASLLFVFDEIVFLPIVIYVPSLAFSQVTGVGIYQIGVVVCAVCIFYTVLGGLRAVVWTDTLQIILMFASVLVVVSLGTVYIGGFSEVWGRCQEGQRLEIFNFNPNPLERHTVWSLVIGGYFYWTSFNAVNQTMVQRYLSLPTLKQAQIAIGIFTVGIIGIVTICCYTGLLIYATYHKCDPLLSEQISDYDQLLPHFMMQTVGQLKGLPGLFMAGIFSAALSSLSTILNSLPSVILEDFLFSCCSLKLSERWEQIVAKGLVLFFGILAVACLFIVEPLEGILEVTTSLTAIAAGTSFGMFALGMLFPIANGTGALCGAIASSLLVGWLSLGAHFASLNGFSRPILPVNTEGCDSLNVTLAYTTSFGNDDVFPLYKLSYLWLAPIGVTTVVSVGLLVSWLTGTEDVQLANPDLFSPVIMRFVPKLGQNRQAGTECVEINLNRHKERVSAADNIANTVS
ncbi:sodium-coupled monocarboxylate transporter 1 [Cloeon dipterum]|uniref:sodium-coupled monocarboxylate transporter 1 n=1 Tax=Cloeon dipterum TaxID=197152 RepID=UPI0032209595